MLIVMTNKHKGNVYSTIDNTEMRAQENIQSMYLYGVESWGVRTEHGGLIGIDYNILI